MARLGFSKAKDQPQKHRGEVKTFSSGVLQPVISEKATRLKDADNSYTFKVSPRANKIMVRREIESLYKVHVTKVEVLKTPAKPKRTGRFSGYESGYHKAIVQVRKGEKIELI